MCCRTSDNRVYMASLLRTSAQIPPRGTSDTLGTLYEIVLEIERKPEGEECLKYHTP